MYVYEKKIRYKFGWLFVLFRRFLYWRKLMVCGFMLYFIRNLQRVFRLYWVVMRFSFCLFFILFMLELVRYNCFVNLWLLVVKFYRKIVVVKYIQFIKICVFIIVNINNNCFNKILIFKVYNYNFYELFRCKGVLYFDNLIVIIKEILL